MSPSWQRAQQNVAGTGSRRKLREHNLSNKHEADEELEVGNTIKFSKVHPGDALHSSKLYLHTASQNSTSNSGPRAHGGHEPFHANSNSVDNEAYKKPGTM